MSINKELLKGATVILVLSVLEKQPMYGYEMIKNLQELSDGTFAFKEGTLYPILHSLEVDDYVEAFWEGPAEGRKRKYYRLNNKGLKLLEEKRQEWEKFSSSMNLIVGGKLCLE